MDLEEKERINDFVRLSSVEAGKFMIKLSIFGTIMLALFIFGNAKFNMEKVVQSPWIILYGLSWFVVVFDIIILKNLQKRQLDYFLHVAVTSGYWSILFFCLSYSMGVRNHIPPFILIIIILCIIPCMLGLIHYRHRVFKSHRKIQFGSPN